MADQKQKKRGNTTPEKQAGQSPAAKPKKEKKPPRYTGWKRVAYYAYIVLTVLSALVVVGYIAFHLFSAAPNVNNRHIDEDGDGVPDEVRTRPPTVTTMVTTDPNTGKVIEYEVEIPGLSADRKKEFYTFLLVGQDQTGGAGYGGNTDTMMLVAYDVPGQKLSVMSLPRDTYVHYRGSVVLLNSVYARAGAGQNGIKRLKEEVGELTGVYPDFTVMIQWEALGELVDAIGGVEFEVPFRMYYNDLSQHFKIDLKKGLQTLNGAQAMQLIRWRQNSDDSGHIDYSYGYADGDLGRIRTQQSFMKAIIKKCLQPEVLMSNLGGFIDVFQRNVETDLTVGNMTYFAKSAIGKLNMDDVTMLTMPNTYAGQHVVPIGSQLVTAINQSFNPYKSNIQRYELDIVDLSETVSSSSTSEPEEVDPVHTPDPDESPDPSGSPRPSSSAKPGSSAEPGETEDPNEPLLPGGATARPSESPRSSESPRPSESGRPNSTESNHPTDSESPRPSESGRPNSSASPRPSESSAPGHSESPKPAESNKPSESPVVGPTVPPTAAPTATPKPTPPPTATPAPVEDEPVLPPGYLG